MQPGTAVKPDARAIVIVKLRFYMSYKRDQLVASCVREAGVSFVARSFEDNTD